MSTEEMALYGYSVLALACTFAMGYLARMATHRDPKQVMMPMRDEHGRFLPWKRGQFVK